jgi:hypothetical protein
VNLHSLLALGFALSASVVSAAPSLHVAPFRGMKTASAVRAQVEERLCAASPCVKASRADFTVLGTLSPRGKKSARVQLEVLAKGQKRAAYRKTWALAPGFKQLADAEAALAELSAAVGAGEGQSGLRPAAAAPASRGADAPAAPPSSARPALDTLDVIPAPAAAAELSTRREEPPASAERAAAPGRVLAEVWMGVDVEARSFDYDALGIKNLRGFRAYTVVQPTVNARVRPLLALGGAWTRLRLEGGFATSVALRASVASRAVTYPSSVTRVDAGLRVDAWDAPGLGLGLEAFAGYRSHGFAVQPASDGSVLDGLAQPTWTALRVGAAATWRAGRVGVFLEGAALPVLGTGDLQSAYFPRTSAFGFEGRLGADVALLPWLGLRLDGHLTRYGARFTTREADAYVAAGATDLYAGASLAIRGSF